MISLNSYTTPMKEKRKWMQMITSTNKKIKMSNSEKLSSEVDIVIAELKKLKTELSEWKATMLIKIELQQRIIRKVCDNLEAIKAQVNSLDFMDNSSFSTMNNLVATSVMRVEMLEAVRCLDDILKLKFN